MTTDEIISLQKHLGVEPDGFWGPASINALQRHLKGIMPTPNPWPKSDRASMTAFYGEPGDERQLIYLVPSVPLLYEGKLCSRVRCHRKVAESLARILPRAFSGAPSIISVFDGCYNFRPMRGSTSLSIHSWGAAIDFDAEHNGNHDHWPVNSTMPLRVMEEFAREGWVSAGAFWGRDAMHFQATQV